MPLGIRSLDVVHLFIFLQLRSYQLQLLPPVKKEYNLDLKQIKNKISSTKCMENSNNIYVFK
jgi:hypothetical protein